MKQRTLVVWYLDPHYGNMLIMLKVYLIRHGQNEDNAKGILNGHRDEPLTDIGIKQAHEIAQHNS